MTREELTAKLRKLTGKTATDIEALDERLDALEAGAGGGGVEFNTLDVTVTFNEDVINNTFMGVITSEIPENTVINDIIKIENVFVQGSGANNFTTFQPLPMLEGRPDSDNNFIITTSETFAKLENAPAGMNIPLGIIFSKIDVTTELTTFTETFKITYV